MSRSRPVLHHIYQFVTGCDYTLECVVNTLLITRMTDSPSKACILPTTVHHGHGLLQVPYALDGWSSASIKAHKTPHWSDLSRLTKHSHIIFSPEPHSKPLGKAEAPEFRVTEGHIQCASNLEFLPEHSPKLNPTNHTKALTSPCIFQCLWFLLFPSTHLKLLLPPFLIFILLRTVTDGQMVHLPLGVIHVSFLVHGHLCIYSPKCFSMYRHFNITMSTY